LPLPLGEGWGEGAFPRIDAKSCYAVWCVPAFETLSETLPYRYCSGTPTTKTNAPCHGGVVRAVSNLPGIETGCETALLQREYSPNT
ncbi:MAG: hypothetical protein AB1733_21905, partial [Thermodesulfobacteriota bacterium]